MAGLPTINLRALLVGVMTADGEAPPDIAVPIGSQAQADAAFGEGSELSRMFKAFFANNFANEVWGLPLAEPVGAVTATGMVTVTTVPTAAGTIHLYIAGEHVPVNIATTDTIANIADAIAAAINADVTLPVTANAITGAVTLTSTFKSVNANEITVSMNYYGSRGGEQTPVGLGITLPATGFLTGGIGTPDFDNAILNLGEEPFEYVAMPYTDSDSLFAWDQEFGFTDQGRWGWQRELFGHVFSAKRGAYADLLLFGDQYNSGVEFDHGVRGGSAIAVIRVGGGLCRESAACPDQRSGATAAGADLEPDQGCADPSAFRLRGAELARVQRPRHPEDRRRQPADDRAGADHLSGQPVRSAR